jgi:hypothetical protein
MGTESFDKYLKRYQERYPGSSREKAKKAYDRALAKRKKKSDFVPLATGRKLTSKKRETTGRTVGQADVSKGVVADRAKREKEVGRRFTDAEWKEYKAKLAARRDAIEGRNR